MNLKRYASYLAAGIFITLIVFSCQYRYPPEYVMHPEELFVISGSAQIEIPSPDEVRTPSGNWTHKILQAEGSAQMDSQISDKIQRSLITRLTARNDAARSMVTELKAVKINAYVSLGALTALNPELEAHIEALLLKAREKDYAVSAEGIASVTLELNLRPLQSEIDISSMTFPEGDRLHTIALEHAKQRALELARSKLILFIEAQKITTVSSFGDEMRRDSSLNSAVHEFVHQIPASSYEVSSDSKSVSCLIHFNRMALNSFRSHLERRRTHRLILDSLRMPRRHL